MEWEEKKQKKSTRTPNRIMGMELTVKAKRETWGSVGGGKELGVLLFLSLSFFYFFGIRREIIVRGYSMEEEYKEMKL